MASPLKALAGANSDADQNSKDIAAKNRMISEYKNSTAPAKPAAPAKPTAPASVDKVNPKGQYGDRPGEQRIDTTEMTKPLAGSYKKGGKVKRTGLAKVHKGERVLNRKQTKKFEKRGGLSALAGR